MSDDATHRLLLAFPRQVSQPHGYPSEPGEIRWTYGEYDGRPFVKAQIFSHGGDGKTRYVDAGITIRSAEIDEVIKALQAIRPRVKGATGFKPASSQASTSRSAKPGHASQRRVKAPLARPHRDERPSPEDIERVRRIERGEE